MKQQPPVNPIPLTYHLGIAAIIFMKSDSFWPLRPSLIVPTTDCRSSDLSRGTSAATYVDPVFLSGNRQAESISPRVKYHHLCFLPPRVFDASRSINGQILTSTSSPPPHNSILYHFPPGLWSAFIHQIGHKTRRGHGQVPQFRPKC